jgi:hypothetical protein
MQFPTGAKEKIDDVDNGVLLLQRARGRFLYSHVAPHGRVNHDRSLCTILAILADRITRQSEDTDHRVHKHHGHG